MIVYTQISKSKTQKKSKNIAKSLPKKFSRQFRPYSVKYVHPYRKGAAETMAVPSLVTNQTFVGKPNIMDPISLMKESPEVREQIIAKSKRLAPIYSKGAVQYISDGEDLTTLGRKIK
jgi:hypothetical protein